MWKICHIVQTTNWNKQDQSIIKTFLLKYTCGLIMCKNHAKVFSLSLSLSTLFSASEYRLNNKLIGPVRYSTMLRPPYLCVLWYSIWFNVHEEDFFWLEKRRVHCTRTAVVSVGDKAETLIRLFFFSRHQHHHHFFKSIQENDTKTYKN